MNRFVRIATMTIAAAIALSAGCARQAKHQLAITGAPEDFSTIGVYNVNITNASGTVDILTKSNLEAPFIEVKRSRPRVEGVMAGPGRHPEQYANAVFSESGGVANITINSTAGDVASAGEWVRIIVYVRSLGHVKVRNSGGHVLVRNAHGGLDIQNATTRLGHGDITCTSPYPVKAPILLSTDDGIIDLYMPPTADVKVDATTGNGVVQVSARKSKVMNVVEKHMSWTGNVNAATHEVTTRAGKGDIKIRIGSAE